MTLTINIESFGAISRYLPDELSLNYTESCLVADVLLEILEQYPAADQLLPYCACAVGENIIPRHTRLQQDSTLVLLSPVAGG
jgi:molybdopterin converting factor small subunit